MALISNGTTVASGGSVTVSSSAVASGTASISVGAVGSYALLRNENNYNISAGSTVSGSLAWGSIGDGWYSGNVGGTWRVMGQCRDSGNNNQGKATVMLRIS